MQVDFMASPKDRIARLEERKRAIDAQLREAKAREKKKARAQDTRRKILLGALLLEEMDRDEKLAKWVRRKLPRYLKRDVDRELFGISSMPTVGDYTTVEVSK